MLNETRPMPWRSIADSVLPGLKPYQPNHRIRPPTAPRMMLWGSMGPPPSRLKTRPSRGPSAIAPASEIAPPMRVHDGRSGEVTERERLHDRQPSVRSPRPVADDRIDEAGHADAVEDVADEAAAADHRARRDRRAGVGEGELEDPERQQRDAGRAVGVRRGPAGRSRGADEAVPRLEHEGEAPRPERDTADAGVDDAFDEDVDRFTRARETGLEHHEADLHAEHQERRDQRPRRVDGVHGRGRAAGVGVHRR